MTYNSTLSKSVSLGTLIDIPNNSMKRARALPEEFQYLSVFSAILCVLGVYFFNTFRLLCDANK